MKSLLQQSSKRQLQLLLTATLFISILMMVLMSFTKLADPVVKRPAPTPDDETHGRVKDQDNIPQSLQGLIGSMEDLKGRHSDFIMPECRALGSMYNWSVNEQYGFLGPFKYLPNYKNPCWLSEKQELKCVPYFYLIGTPKGGSSDIFHRMVQHPQVFSGRNKEIRWFDRKRFEDKSYATFESYVQFYAYATSTLKRSLKPGTEYHHQVIGDGGPSYYFSSYHWRSIPGNRWCSTPRVTAISHIHHLYPSAKLIMTIRNPTTRLYSHYHFNYIVLGANRTAVQFHEWVLRSVELWNTCLSQHPIRYCLYDGEMQSKTKTLGLNIGLYSRYILDILKIFPRKQILFVHLEDYSINTKEWIRKIFDFLDLEPFSEDQLERIASLKQTNKTKMVKRDNKTEPMLEKTRKLVDDFYAPFNRELADILQDDKYLWLDS